MQIIKYPNDILTTKCEDVIDIDLEEIREMTDFLLNMDDALALAAPQVGILKRIAVFNMVKIFDHPDIPPAVLINPVITHLSGTKSGLEEGCLSFPGSSGMVVRPTSIDLSYISVDSIDFNIHANGLFSKVIQHEIDHLNGILFTEHLKPKIAKAIKRKMK